MSCILCIGVSAEYVVHIIWRAIRILEMCGLTVISVVTDGCSTNRKFVRLHKIAQYQKSGITYLAPIISSPVGLRRLFRHNFEHNRHAKA